LSQEVQGVSLNLEKEGGWEWKEGEEVGYSVKAGYLRLRGGRVGEREGDFMKFWKCKVVPSAHVMAWRVLKISWLLRLTWKNVGSRW